ncbi:MAG: RloB family protein [Thiotrichales bacterium]|nr:RloB family protein [Thiotrichales bacterium]
MSRARRIARRHSNRPLAVRIVVATEGVLTEPEYLKLFSRFHGHHGVRVESIGVGGDPRAVVERAIEESKKLKNDRLARRDSVWAMFDRDIHARFDEAINLAHGNNIRLAISNPCFELWGILHYQEQHAPLNRHECQRKLGELCPDFNAGAGKVFNDWNAVEQHYSAAVERAEIAAQRREEEGTPGGNPTTTVYILTEFIRCVGNG